MTHASIFSGIGAADLAADWMGWENVFNCEINSYCRSILKYYWPNATSYDDIINTDFTIYRGKIDVLTGGFPCQPFSTSGEGKGEADDRFLWPELLRTVRETQPRWVVGENVRGITSKKFESTFESICSSLEDYGYEVQPILIPATAVGAEHQRYRVWIIAHSRSSGLSGQGSLLGPMQPTKIGDRETSRFVDFIQRNAMPFVCSEHHGISRKLDEQALHGYGNAIVPQVVHQIFKAIEQYEKL